MAEVRAWMVKAAHDLDAATRLLDGDEPLSDVAVYHCQQAAEKALKGYLTFQGSPFSKTHSLSTLVEQAAEIDADFAELLDHAEELSPFAWRFRYPGDPLDPDETESQSAISCARSVLGFVKAKLPAECCNG